ncbi:general secretion pathway protein G [Cyanobacterium stanieri PCC 7202]|uniref:General secretion pathway protein G n=1 Tax=Cyanobacterium stanieri (strain ATCC 29140 / PCC 7202) TaxID=292563 RepID=K9YQB9_CYASC|nr:general secretion pathway protein G [Cyanobacterium stanieri PCC 7202]
MKNSTSIQKILRCYLEKKPLTQKGFTMIELLVVIILLASLAIVALPNFLNQIGRAREVEYQNALGAINRSQQAHHFENGFFVQEATDQQSLRRLGMRLNTLYIDEFNIAVDDTYPAATTSPSNSNYQEQGTRAYSSAIFFEAGFYTGTVCASLQPTQQIPPPTSPTDCGDHELLK